MSKKNLKENEDFEGVEESREPQEQQPEAKTYTREEAIEFHKKQLGDLEKQEQEESIMKTFPEWKVEVSEYIIKSDKAITDLQQYVKSFHKMLIALQDKIEIVEKMKK